MQIKQKMVIIAWISATLVITLPAHAWSNGGYSTDPDHPIQGTHDIILEKAISILPPAMQARINTTIASYGTELPDCKTGIYCIGDTTKHHVYYRANGSLQDNASAIRARQEYDLAKFYLDANDTYNFSLHIGAMSHYISDMAVFGHTMGASTDWGTEVHHDDYESYVDNHPDYFFSAISFDGKFENISAYNATLNLANETTFDEGIHTNVWMDHNYNWSNLSYKPITQTRLNYTVNLLADVLRTLIVSRGDTTPTPTPTPTPTSSITIRGVTITPTTPSAGNEINITVAINNPGASFNGRVEGNVWSPSGTGKYLGWENVVIPSGASTVTIIGPAGGAESSYMTHQAGTYLYDVFLENVDQGQVYLNATDSKKGVPFNVGAAADVYISNVSLSASPTNGSVMALKVTISNPTASAFNGTIDANIWDSVRGYVLTPQSISIAAGSSTTLIFSYNPVNQGLHSYDFFLVSAVSGQNTKVPWGFPCMDYVAGIGFTVV
jgi:hypothetical protein